MAEKIKLGVSSCLLGNKVRYDGGHKLDHFLRDTLGHFVDFVPVCPEVECGLPVPREAMHLVGDPDQPRLVTRNSGIDHTARMQTWAQKRLDQLEKEDLCGFIFKKNSPSSGMQRVKVYNAKGVPVAQGSGLFAKAYMERFPRLPVEEEGRLHDPNLRENFIERIFALQRWRRFLSRKPTPGTLMDFHAQEKLLLLAHSPQHYRQMGQLVAGGKHLPTAELMDSYERLLLEALQRMATVAKHGNVLQHLLGYFKKQLTDAEKQEMLGIIADFRQHHLPLIVPVTLAKHYVLKYRQPYLTRQTYLNPHPIALQLRNHA
jgi:uncharacterized protein YbgA (DUF1722 family)/uncharacterized protein YbbK (DUF523 family)